MDDIVKIINLNKSYKSKNNVLTQVLISLSLNVKKNEYLALMGPSGAGKSTLLFLLGALDKPDAGEIIYKIDNKEYFPANMNDKKLSGFRNKELGFIFQFHYLLPEFTAVENVMIPSMILGDSKNKSNEIAIKLLEKVGLKDKLHNKPSELSGGEQQRVAIARALINNPKILLADEPTGNLDSKNSEMVIELLHQIKSEYNLTLIIATHSDYVANSADRVCHLIDGKIEF